ARRVARPVERSTTATFALTALAVRIRDQFYVRSIQRVNADGSLTFYCAVDTGIVLTAMASRPLLPDLQKQMTQLRQRLGEPVLIIACDCVLRRLEAELRGQDDELAAYMASNAVVGFNTYAEQFNGM